MKNKTSARRKTQFSSIRKGLFAAVIIILLVLSLKLMSVFKNSLWDGEERINFVVSVENTTLVSFEPSEKTLTFLEIPNNTLMEVTHGYGEYQLGAITRLGDLEKRKNLLSETIQENLALRVTGFIQAIKSQEAKVNNKNNLNDLLGEAIWGKSKTNLSGLDLLRLWWQIRKVKESDVLIFNLEKRDLLTSKTLADKTQVYTIDTPIFDLKMQNLLPLLTLKKENLTLEILNSTKYLGLADKAARILNNIGARVVSTGNYETELKKCILRGTHKIKNMKTTRIIQSLYDCQWKDETGEESRADITLILGDDYFQKLFQK